ncbi:MAG: hypothetical protein A3I07_00510 [Candidatus Doudnabacteria bacterium RIFCSPLOWO2_02_FULL_42_9]|uniref:Uncharacterized protein n=1 Tax=Candidatus Doudnabacteria bacterium RIFCSPHIGHO2_01_FULL_41_86 TaxID=1817821 RepID=A0A1F5N9F7_9BACT|nr:MAG: hypothetical protein A2717_01835 [Candidatus Doudnabacteria bacterium RIFCSPHIGHO2_01_FULL_41_86]OGE74985.1 MAG: hypothetical protein A3K07_04415 [Candidatus Doudnabacteria bacterium RIFCSPHIGHO2_01_43_10]OGE85308.1 MAG: hypothetical protein A3E28_01405 [Candidatus Doudnabacteria bacterium RIFCSPHIGHO2_12_FULL_42_22]OGE86846.1 MAG: hypothetical protein A3C49_02240 [Candidatus Doudnabacteria bacterium RIFCSPHIGHO2_02_FULL_42_25]OGE91509.1 MAG: hypothetical protein A3K08_02825 [Candidatus
MPQVLKRTLDTNPYQDLNYSRSTFVLESDMKTLTYRRHSLKDGHYISKAGIELARDEAEVYESRPDAVEFSCVFHGPFVRTAQTALAFCCALTVTPPDAMPIIEEIGNDAIVALIVNDAFKAAVAKGESNYQATVSSHSATELSDLSRTAMAAVTKMFDAMKDKNDVGIAFGHSPIIELAVCNMSGLPDGWNELNEMDGLVLEQDDAGQIRVVELIRANREQPATA